MWEQINRNKRNSVILVVVMAFVLFAIGYFVGELFYPGYGIYGLLIGFVIWVLQLLISYFYGDKIFLGISKARKISRDMHPTLYNVVEEMKIASRLSHIPDVYIIDDPALNAFATGRKPENSAVAVTSGLLEILTRDELQGVIAHEIGHIKNRDILYMTMVGIMMGTIVLLADLGLRRKDVIYYLTSQLVPKELQDMVDERKLTPQKAYDIKYGTPQSAMTNLVTIGTNNFQVLITIVLRIAVHMIHLHSFLTSIPTICTSIVISNKDSWSQ